MGKDEKNLVKDLMLMRLFLLKEKIISKLMLNFLLEGIMKGF
jgi:hypothetical protein